MSTSSQAAKGNTVKEDTMEDTRKHAVGENRGVVGIGSQENTPVDMQSLMKYAPVTADKVM
jgi:hypothetical protein